MPAQFKAFYYGQFERFFHGYGYIYSVIYKEPKFWESVKEEWDKNFLPTKDNINLLVSYYDYYKSNLYGTGINFTEKHHREGTLSGIIKSLGLRPTDVDDILVKPFITNSHYSSLFSSAELFIEIYLFTFIEAKHATTLFRREFFKNWIYDINHPNVKCDDDYRY